MAAVVMLNSNDGSIIWGPTVYGDEHGEGTDMTASVDGTFLVMVGHGDGGTGVGISGRVTKISVSDALRYGMIAIRSEGMPSSFSTSAGESSPRRTGRASEWLAGQESSTTRAATLRGKTRPTAMQESETRGPGPSRGRRTTGRASCSRSMVMGCCCGRGWTVTSAMRASTSITWPLNPPVPQRSGSSRERGGK